jgi:hypothetical protein
MLFCLKYFLLFLIAICQLGPSGVVFLEFYRTAFYSEVHFNISSKHFLSSSLQWSLCCGHLAANWVLISWACKHENASGTPSNCVDNGDWYLPCAHAQFNRALDTTSTASLLAQWLHSRTLVVDWMAVQVFWETVTSQLDENIHN